MEYEMQIRENKSEIGSLRREKKEIEDEISKEVKSTLETLLLELEKSTKKVKELHEMNEEYKCVMGDQQVKIVRLEAQMKSGDESSNEGMSNSMKLKQSFYGEHLQLDVRKKDNDIVV
jgi:molybdopterin converting factor small subunit